MTRPDRMEADATLAAAQWHARQREGALDAAERDRFMAWLTASPGHLREYLAIARIAGELGEAIRAMPAETGDAPPRGNVVALPLPARRAVAVPAPRSRLRGARFAAAAVLVLGLGIAAHLGWPRTIEYATAHGAPRRIELPDGTLVHLNAQSALAARFNAFARRVELTRGQASFVVAAERRPFAVEAAGLRIRDIGTTFDVSLRREQARVDVVEGRVHVVADGRLLADLGAGQRARIAHRDRAVSVSREDVAAMTAWWHGRIVFRDEPLQEVADQFNRLNRVRIQVEDAAAGRLRLTGSLRGGDVASLRAFLDGQPGLATTVEGDLVRVAARH